METSDKRFSLRPGRCHNTPHPAWRKTAIERRRLDAAFHVAAIHDLDIARLLPSEEPVEVFACRSCPDRPPKAARALAFAYRSYSGMMA